MMGRQTSDRPKLFDPLNLEGRIPVAHLLLCTAGRAHNGRTILFRASKLEFDVCTLKNKVLSDEGNSERRVRAFYLAAVITLKLARHLITPRVAHAEHLTLS
jgi:hypothetical protein